MKCQSFEKSGILFIDEALDKKEEKKESKLARMSNIFSNSGEDKEERRTMSNFKKLSAYFSKDSSMNSPLIKS